MAHLLAPLLLVPLAAKPNATAPGDPNPAWAVVPAPAEVRWTDEAFAVEDSTRVVVEDDGLLAHALVLAEELRHLTGRSVRIAESDEASGTPAIRLRTRPSAGTDAAGLPMESYRLRVGAEAAIAEAGGVEGISRATATLLQCVDVGEDGTTIRGVVVEDRPLAPFRSVMVDVARSPHSIAVLEDAIRLARLFKIRFVHLHLTDDQHFTFPFEHVVSGLTGNFSYSRAELEGLVRYADARGVTLIPEIDLPGHSRRLVESGYLPGAERDRDVASPEHAERISALVDDVLEVFDSSPYFHIGGDESGAGDRLVPFLARVNEHVRGRGRRLMVWEGFHGAPTDALPARGDDRILVASWESSYNPPWSLLEAGYELVNASWRPLYIVGGDSTVHPGSTAGRRWSPGELARWNKDRFMHWEPGRPVFEDRGPGDVDRDDGIWDVPRPSWRDAVLGGQISVWEQRESSLVRDLRPRVPVVAERLWSGTTRPDRALLAAANEVDGRLFALVQPAAIALGPTEPGPMNGIAATHGLDTIGARLESRIRIEGEVRWTLKPAGASFDWIPGVDHPSPDAGSTEPVALIEGGATIRARFFDAKGAPVGAGTWTRVLPWPPRVRVTDLAIGRRAPRDAAEFAALLDGAPVLSRHTLPMLRGPLRHERVKGQRLEATLRAPSTGSFEIAVKTQSGHATLWLDLDGDGQHAEDERLIPFTPSTEERIRAAVELEEGRRYALRLDHVTDLPRPVLIVTLDEPGAERPAGISPHLEPL